MHGDAGSRYQAVEVRERRRRVLPAVLSRDALPRFSPAVVFLCFFCPLNILPPLQLFTFFLSSFLRGFGFVTYAEQAGVEKVLAQNRHELDSKTVSPACLRHWVDFTDSFERACHPPLPYPCLGPVKLRSLD